MIPAVAQTLACLLAKGTSLGSTEQISFSHPGNQSSVRPLLSLYLYSIQENHRMQQRSLPSSSSPLSAASPTPVASSDTTRWYDMAFLVTAWDHTALGEQRLLSEALHLLLQYSCLPEEALVTQLRGQVMLPLQVSTRCVSEEAVLWHALRVPLRPAFSITVTVPFHSPSDAIASDYSTMATTP